MPCSGIAVANGVVKSDVKEYIEKFGEEALAQLLKTYLSGQFSDLGEVRDVDLIGRHRRFQIPGVGLEIGNILINVNTKGRVTVNTKGQASYGDRQKVREIQEKITDALNTWGAVARQQDIISQIKAAGFEVTTQQTAHNGAIVIDVEV